MNWIRSWMFVRRSALAGLFALFVPEMMPAGAAQDLPPQEMDALYARAMRTQNADSIRTAVERLRKAVSESPVPGGVLTRIGMLYLRLEDAENARSAFLQALERDTTLAAARCGLARVYMDLMDNPKRAQRYLQDALSADSTYVEAYYYLARAYMKMGREQARQAAGKALQLDPNFAPAYLLLARIYDREGNRQVALTYYKKYLEVNPNPENQAEVYEFALDLLEGERFDEVVSVTRRMGGVRGLPLLATALIRQGDYEGALEAFERYIAGLSEKEQALYDDISLVGLPRDVAAYQTVTPKTREAFLRRFWMRRDPFKVSGGAMRRAEHYRRVWYARTFYGRKKWPWDRRGEVYIRYGEPDYRSNWRKPNASVPPKVQRIQEKLALQLYGDKSIPMTFVGPVFPIRMERTAEFADRGAGEKSQPIVIFKDVGLERWKPVVAGNDWTAVPWEVWVYADIDEGLEVAFTDEYHSGIYDYAPVPTPSLHDLEMIQLNREGPTRRLVSRLNEYAPELRVARVASQEPERYNVSNLEPLGFYYEALSFRGRDGKTDVQVNLGIPVDNVAMPGDVDTTVLVDRRVALVDSQYSRAKKARDVLAVLVSDATRRTGLMARDRVNLNVSPGAYLLAVQVGRKYTRRMQVFRQSLDVPDYSGDRLALSDIQLAQHVIEAGPRSDPRFVRGKWQIIPSPSGAFFAGDPVFTYFEIYNLTRDEFGATHYDVTYEVRVKGKGYRAPLRAKILKPSGEAVSVHYEQTGTETAVSDYLQVELEKAREGYYTARMTVRDLNSGQVATKERTFRILRRPK